MKGTILYLRKLREICRENKGDCKACPLGKGELKETLCPRLTSPMYWTDKKTTEMARRV